MSSIMCSRYRASVLNTLLKEYYTRIHCQPSIRRRSYATEPVNSSTEPEDKNVAVLGGGITGLASAFYLSEALPKANITLYEGGSRLGGWLHSTVADVDGGKVVFEQGPRTLRPNAPNGWVTLDLIQRLRLEDEVLMTSKNSVAAQNRYIYYPDHLVRMPGPGLSFLEQLKSLITEPIFKGLVPGVFLEPFRYRRPSQLEDESVGSFISRRFGKSLADNVISAVFQGIYAGDIYQLSARSTLPKLWQYEQTDNSIMRGVTNESMGGYSFAPGPDIKLMISLKQRMLTDGKSLEKLEILRQSSVFTFKRGIGQLASRIESLLESKPNVKIYKNTLIGSLQRVSESGSQMMKLTPTPGNATSSAAQKAAKPQAFTHVISTLSGKALSALTRGHLDILSQTPSVTVMVVNLFYSNPSLLSVHGFGYLLPRSLPLFQNPERALGVVFDSDATIGQDNVPGTKVTVMLGGHWWDGWSAYPNEHEGAEMAKSILERHLGVTEKPQFLKVGLQRDCIPQYTVGHTSRMRSAAEQLEKHYRGRLRVAGNSYTGVGLNDCVRAARDVVDGLVNGTGRTGLESFSNGEAWVKVLNKVESRS